MKGEWQRVMRGGGGIASKRGAAQQQLQVLQIQEWNSEVRPYTPGARFPAHPCPHDTMPTWIHSPARSTARGPPESPWQASRPPPSWYAHSIRAVMPLYICEQ